MTAPLLALDLGNSSLKACLFSAGGGAPSAVLEPGADLVDWLRSLEPPSAVGLSSVADEARTAEVAAALEVTLGRAPSINPDCGLSLEVETPETTGRDRLYAARAALEVLGAPCLVVDVGTALTVDAVRPGAFLGGAIAPGPALLARALTDGGARLPAFEPAPDVPALGRSTVDALRAGVGVGVVGAAWMLVERVAAEAALSPHSPVFLTGGASAYLEVPFAEGPRPLRVDPWLVLRGLVHTLSP